MVDISSFATSRSLKTEQDFDYNKCKDNFKLSLKIKQICNVNLQKQINKS